MIYSGSLTSSFTFIPSDSVKGAYTRYSKETNLEDFTPETAICQFFKKGVKCEDSKKVCVKFLE